MLKQFAARPPIPTTRIAWIQPVTLGSPDLVHKTLTSTEKDDEYAVAGKRFAFQLRGMEEKQRFIAEKLISDVMFYGRIGKLSEDATIYFPPNKAASQSRIHNNYNTARPLQPPIHFSSFQPPHGTLQPLEEHYRSHQVTESQHVGSGNDLHSELSDYITLN